jgi:hypothetical protein
VNTPNEFLSTSRFHDEHIPFIFASHVGLKAWFCGCWGLALRARGKSNASRHSRHKA